MTFKCDPSATCKNICRLGRISLDRIAIYSRKIERILVIFIDIRRESTVAVISSDIEANISNA